ncbi:MAG: ABC transporter substrate-binding protein [Simplicispira suum]|uniref:ABC transporter substrate-binding protein n=1 Tax=Simplicispira suum TaxID=2109915 RepID=UPI001C6C3036|nr:ABC transporter substrate-binding protein [Simplicispira suum]MBW7834451.1 ABC transporter substrate-binding protein [Simplicispira suum]
MPKKRCVLGMLLSLALLAPWGALRASPGVTDSEIVIGQSLGLTGPLAAMAPELVNITKTYIDGVNAQGGVHGRRIRMVTEDDGYKPENSVRLVGKMIAQDHVFALANLTGTANVGAVLPLLAKENPPVPLISPFTGADLLREPPINHVFNVRASYGDEVEKLVQHLTTLGVQRISVLWMNNGFGKDGLAGARKSMEKRGLNLHSDAPIQVDSSDVQQAVQILSATEPDAIIMITAGAPTVAFIKAYRKVSRAARFYTTSVMGSQSTIQALGSDGIGVVVTSVVPFPWSQSMPVAREYREVLKKAGMEATVSFIGLETFINAKVMVECLRRAGRDLTRPRFIQAMESMQRFDVGGFEVDFGKGARQGSRFVDLTIIGAGGKFTR